MLKDVTIGISFPQTAFLQVANLHYYQREIHFANYKLNRDKVSYVYSRIRASPDQPSKKKKNSDVKHTDVDPNYY